jgi:hypothetical protein
VGALLTKLGHLKEKDITYVIQFFLKKEGKR